MTLMLDTPMATVHPTRDVVFVLFCHSNTVCVYSIVFEYLVTTTFYRPFIGTAPATTPILLGRKSNNGGTQPVDCMAGGLPRTVRQTSNGRRHRRGAAREVVSERGQTRVETPVARRPPSTGSGWRRQLITAEPS